MTGAEVRAELLSPGELDARIAEYPLVYMPLGSLEFHGPHLPVGLDALTAHGVCIRAATITGGIVLPAVYQGTGGAHGPYPWTIMMASAAGIRSHIVQTLDRLELFGVRGAALFSGHFAGEQLELIEGIAENWNAEPDHTLHVLATSINKCPTSPITADHAGIFESTLLHALHPKLVHVERLSLEVSTAPDGDQWGSQRHDPNHPLWGVFGSDPRNAKLATSGELLDTIVGWLASIAGRRN